LSNWRRITKEGRNHSFKLGWGIDDRKRHNYWMHRKRS
jgi:hypothetical protein